MGGSHDNTFGYFALQKHDEQGRGSRKEKKKKREHVRRDQQSGARLVYTLWLRHFESNINLLGWDTGFTGSGRDGV